MTKFVLAALATLVLAAPFTSAQAKPYKCWNPAICKAVCGKAVCGSLTSSQMQSDQASAKRMTTIRR